jgi:hypothetical protein
VPSAPAPTGRPKGRWVKGEPRSGCKKNSGWASLGGFKGRPVWNSRSCHTGCSWRVAMKDMKRIRKLHPPWSFDLLSAESQSPKTPLRARSFTESVVFVPCHIYYMTWLHCRHQFHPYNQKWHFFPRMLGPCSASCVVHRDLE